MLAFTKELEGKTIYMVPTGNAARMEKDVVEKAVVTKVSQVFVTLLINGYKYETKMRKHHNQDRYSNRIESGSNSGYICYYSEDEILLARKYSKAMKDIKSVISVYNGVSDEDKIVLINKIISGLEKEENNV